MLGTQLSLAAALATYRLLRGPSRRDALLATLAAFGFSMPLQGLILTGNANVVIWLGLTLVCSAIVGGRASLAPGVLAACTWIKLYPAALVLPLAWRGDWRAIRRYALTSCWAVSNTWPPVAPQFAVVGRDALPPHRSATRFP